MYRNKMWFLSALPVPTLRLVRLISYSVSSCLLGVANVVATRAVVIKIVAVDDDRGCRSTHQTVV